METFMDNLAVIWITLMAILSVVFLFWRINFLFAIVGWPSLIHIISSTCGG